MATYKRRGYKPSSKKQERELERQKSTTAEVFSTLDEGASRTEAWVAKNQKYILAVVGIIAAGVLGYLAYQNYVLRPMEREATNESYQAMKYFEQALTSSDSDSLLTLALEGGEGKYGLIDIIGNYEGTKTANLASYSAGMAYLDLKNYENAIKYLSDFSTDNVIYGALANGGIGDAFVQLDQLEDALTYYDRAITFGDNGFTTPKYLLKAGLTSMEMGDPAKALSYFNRIKAEFKDSEEARNIDAFIGKAEYMQ